MPSETTPVLQGTNSSTQKRVLLPQKATTYDVEGVGMTSKMTTTVRYENTLGATINDLLFRFPVSTRAAFHSAKATFGDGTVVVAVCKERAAASNDFKQAQAQGRTAVLIEQVADNDDLVDFTIGSLAAGATVTIETVCDVAAATTTVFHGGETRTAVLVSIPTNVLPWYGDHAAKAPKAVTDVVASDGAVVVPDVTVNLRWNGLSAPIAAVTSPSHPDQLAVALGFGGGWTVASLEGLRPDRTIQLAVVMARDTQLTATVNDDGILHVQGLFDVALARTPVTAAVLLDVSGSMGTPGPSGAIPLDTAKAATKMLLQELPRGSSVTALQFNDDVIPFNPVPPLPIQLHGLVFVCDVCHKRFNKRSYNVRTWAPVPAPNNSVDICQACMTAWAPATQDVFNARQDWSHTKACSSCDSGYQWLTREGTPTGPCATCVASSTAVGYDATTAPALEAWIDGARAQCGTQFVPPIRQALSLPSTPDKPLAIFMITDGEVDTQTQRELQELFAATATTKPFRFYAVCVGTSSRPAIVEALTAMAGGSVETIQSLTVAGAQATLTSIVQRQVARACGGYVGNVTLSFPDGTTLGGPAPAAAPTALAVARASFAGPATADKTSSQTGSLMAFDETATTSAATATTSASTASATAMECVTAVAPAVSKLTRRIEAVLRPPGLERTQWQPTAAVVVNPWPLATDADGTQLPVIYRGKPFQAFVVLRDHDSVPAQVTLTGTTPSGVTLSATAAVGTVQATRTPATRLLAHALLKQATDAADKDAATRLAVDMGLLSKYTSLVAVATQPSVDPLSDAPRLSVVIPNVFPAPVDHSDGRQERAVVSKGGGVGRLASLGGGFARPASFGGGDGGYATPASSNVMSIRPGVILESFGGGGDESDGDESLEIGYDDNVSYPESAAMDVDSDSDDDDTSSTATTATLASFFAFDHFTCPDDKLKSLAALLGLQASQLFVVAHTLDATVGRDVWVTVVVVTFFQDVDNLFVSQLAAGRDYLAAGGVDVAAVTSAIRGAFALAQ
jgi:hypothetical protein